MPQKAHNFTCNFGTLPQTGCSGYGMTSPQLQSKRLLSHTLHATNAPSISCFTQLQLSASSLCLLVARCSPLAARRSRWVSETMCGRNFRIWRILCGIRSKVIFDSDISWQAITFECCKYLKLYAYLYPVPVEVTARNVGLNKLLQICEWPQTIEFLNNSINLNILVSNKN